MGETREQRQKALGPGRNRWVPGCFDCLFFHHIAGRWGAQLRSGLGPAPAAEVSTAGLPGGPPVTLSKVVSSNRNKIGTTKFYKGHLNICAGHTEKMKKKQAMFLLILHLPKGQRYYYFNKGSRQ